jgi:hypothetical protein
MMSYAIRENDKAMEGVATLIGFGLVHSGEEGGRTTGNDEIKRCHD